jgi:hypothetical protein
MSLDFRVYPGSPLSFATAHGVGEPRFTSASNCSCRECGQGAPPPTPIHLSLLALMSLPCTAELLGKERFHFLVHSIPAQLLLVNLTRQLLI